MIEKVEFNIDGKRFETTLDELVLDYSTDPLDVLYFTFDHDQEEFREFSVVFLEINGDTTLTHTFDEMEAEELFEVIDNYGVDIFNTLLDMVDIDELTNPDKFIWQASEWNIVAEFAASSVEFYKQCTAAGISFSSWVENQFEYVEYLGDNKYLMFDSGN